MPRSSLLNVEYRFGFGWIILKSLCCNVGIKIEIKIAEYSMKEIEKRQVGRCNDKVDFDEMKADLNANPNYQWKVISC